MNTSETALPVTSLENAKTMSAYDLFELNERFEKETLRAVPESVSPAVQSVAEESFEGWTNAMKLAASGPAVQLAETVAVLLATAVIATGVSLLL